MSQQMSPLASLTRCTVGLGLSVPKVTYCVQIFIVNGCKKSNEEPDYLYLI